MDSSEVSILVYTLKFRSMQMTMDATCSALRGSLEAPSPMHSFPMRPVASWDHVSISFVEYLQVWSAMPYMAVPPEDITIAGEVMEISSSRLDSRAKCSCLWLPA